MAGMKFMMVYMMPIMMLLWFNSYSSALLLLPAVEPLYHRPDVADPPHGSTTIRSNAVMQANAAKRSKGKKSKFQQRYEELLRQQEAQQRTKRK